MAGWMHRQQEDLIDYLREENRVPREQLGSQPLRLTDEQSVLSRTWEGNTNGAR